MVCLLAACGGGGGSPGTEADTGAPFGGSTGDASGGDPSTTDVGPHGGATGGGGPGGAPGDASPTPVDAGPIQDRTPPPPDLPVADASAPPADAAVPCPDGGCPPGPCQTDTDCPGSRACVEGLCPEASPCFAVDDCDAPRVCAAGACMDPCRGDDDCAEGTRCDPDAGACLPDRACEEDADCPGTRACVDGQCPEPPVCFAPQDCDEGRACRDGTCEAACGPAAPCAGRLVCDPESSLCIEGESCGGPADCLNGRVCAGGFCQDRCVDDALCPGTRHCDLATGLCPEPDSCFVPQDCDGDRLCRDQRCVDACNEMVPCPGAQRCDQMNGVCVEPEICRADEDCPRGLCDAGECHPPCNVDADCGAPRTCDADSGRCLSPARCVADRDCTGREVCGPAGTCFLPDCEVNEDCPGACVDQRCAEAAPSACGPGVACAGGLDCTPLGACALDGPCEDATCPPGAPVCDPANARCTGCVSDLDCAAAEVCQSGRCALGRPCGQDADCPGDRTCLAGICLPVACEGDRFDRDPAGAQLVTRTYTGLVLCDGDEDRYDVTLPAGAGLRVLLRHDPAVGDLSLFLDDPTAMPPASRQSDRQDGVEIVGAVAGEAPRPLSLRVQGRAGWSVPYSLTLERMAPEACVPDAWEGPFGNDDPAHAAPVGLHESEVELCPGDRDVLSLELPAGTRLTVSAQAASPGQSVDLALSDPRGRAVSSVIVTDRPTELAADVSLTGTYLLTFQGGAADTRTRVRFSASLVPTTEAAACADPLVLPVSDEPTLLPVHEPARRFNLGCGVGTDPDHLLELTLPAPAVVDLETTGATTVAVRGTCDDPGSEAACDASEAPALRGVRLEAGTWFVVVKSGLFDRPSVTLRTAALCQRDADCGLDGFCVAGACQARCARNVDCPGAQTCNVATGRCQEPAVCTADEDCNAGRRCRYDGDCFVPDCVENEDCEGACVDETCAEAAPAACRSDDDCLGLQVCAPVGACVQPAACADDVDCPGGTPVCEFDSGECRACLTDDHCQAGETCRGGVCEYLGACDGPGDCPGTRVCGNDHLCRPAEGCPGDRFDGQEPPARLVARTYGGLLLCDGTQDRYLVEPRVGEGLRITLRHDPRAGDLALSLSALPPLLDRYGTSDDRLGVETVLLPPAELIQPALVAVTGKPGAAVPYSLTIERTGADVCAPDPLEGVLGNDRPESATALTSAGPHTVSLCPADEDWFDLRLAAGTRLVASVSSPELLLSLHDDEGGVLAEAMPQGGRAVVGGEFLAPARAYLRLRAPDDTPRRQVDLQLEATPTADAQRLACQHAAELVPGRPLAPPDTLRVARFEVPCAAPFPGLTGDLVARFTLAAPGRVSFEVSDGSAVALRRDCEDPGSQVVCALAGAPELTDIALQAGAYTVVVQAFGPVPPQVLLNVR